MIFWGVIFQSKSQSFPDSSLSNMRIRLLLKIVNSYRSEGKYDAALPSLVNKAMFSFSYLIRLSQKFYDLSQAAV